MTQMDYAQDGKITGEMEAVALEEKVDIEHIRAGVACGEIVIPKNIRHSRIKPVGIGKGLRTKVNANLGTSTDCDDLQLEIRKAKIAVDAGADTIMDLSTGGDIIAVRRAMIEDVPVVIGTVPI